MPERLTMKLISDWRHVLQRAWSIKLLLLAAVFCGAEAALPLLCGFIPPRLFAALSFLTVAGAFVARILAQKDMDDE